MSAGPWNTLTTEKGKRILIPPGMRKQASKAFMACHKEKRMAARRARVARRQALDQRKANVLGALRDGKSKSGACLDAGVQLSTFYMWLHDDTEFAIQVQFAIEEGTDRLEDEAYRRGRDGVLRINKNGTSTIEYSDRLLMFMLEGRRAWKYRRGYDNDTPPAADPRDLEITAETDAIDASRAYTLLIEGEAKK